VFFFLILVVKLNQGPQLIEKMELMMENKEEGSKICELLERNTTSLETTCAKMGQMSEMTKILMKRQERIKKQVNCWTVKQ
jgi:hypothetical protein